MPTKEELKEFINKKGRWQMSEKLVPAVKSVPRGDGVKQGSANKTLTTPNHPEPVSVFSDKGKGSKEKIF